MKNLILAACLLVLLPSLAAGQTPNDYQFRPLMHWQIADANGQGLAGWVILPDVTQTRPLRGLLVGGWLIKDDQGWKEAMFGGLFGNDGSIIPVVNFRAYSKVKWTDLSTEFQIRPTLALGSVFLTVPIKSSWGLRAGVEFETIAGFTGQIKSAAGIGPRVSLKLPGLPNVTVATTCFFNIRSNIVVRTYVVYKPGK